MSKPATKQIEVQIMGQSYLLACPEGGEQSLLEAVERVDTAMCRIRDAGKVKARDRIAVLASLNLAFELSQKDSQPPQTSVTPTVATPFPTGQTAAQWESRADELVRRLDQALSSDGQLL